MITIERQLFDTTIADGKPYFGTFMHAFQGLPIRHGYMAALVDVIGAACPDRPLRILEVGSWAGGSAVTWASALDKLHASGGSVACIDSWTPYFDPDAYSETSGPVYRSMADALNSGEIFRLFQHNVRASGHENRVIPIIGRSQEVLPLLAEAAFDIVFVDGAHDYQSIRSDLSQAKRLVREGGVLCGDDLEIQLDQVDEKYARANGHLDYVRDPKTGISYHPGVCLAVAELCCPVSCWEGFWALRKQGGQFSPLAPDPFVDKEIAVPSHISERRLAQPELVVHDYKGFNIISYLGVNWGIAQRVGSMDLTVVDVRKVDELVRAGLVIRADTPDGAKHAIDQSLREKQ